MVDSLFASCGIEPEIVASAEQVAVVSGLVLPVASVGHLIAMTLLARDNRRRPLDADDLRSLRATARDRDWAVAADAVAFVGERGYARDDFGHRYVRYRTFGGPPAAGQDVGEVSPTQVG